jgi:hypothetical protein
MEYEDASGVCIQKFCFVVVVSNRFSCSLDSAGFDNDMG